MKFVAYSDIHFTEQYFNGAVTLEDILAVERQITSVCRSNYIKQIIFAGDMFKMTNPFQQVVMSAESVWVERSHDGIETVMLKGNHDADSKSIDSKHAFERVKIFTEDLSRVSVVDKPEWSLWYDVAFLFVPSGWENVVPPKPEYLNNRPLVVVLHGLIKGAYFSNNQAIKDGIDPEIIKLLSPNLVIAGDVHNNQRLDHLFGCPSLYLGAPMWHTYGDVGQKRGFWAFDVSEKGVEIEFFPSFAPCPIRMTVDTLDGLEEKVQTEFNKVLPSLPILELTIKVPDGTKVDREALHKKFIQKARAVKIIIQYEMQKIQAVDNFNLSATYEDKWNEYISQQDMVELQPQVIIDIGNKLIADARKSL